ncbi:irregular chiasm C-roughest protein isoform X2 [Cryptotermes secundus]|nr:irregular chiasm C-roughest protein isoform X2 [Cryptotermes secundus]XP_023718819.1 irregular chiasm C-roughest protein isoform X2 [Cryptotermes secundus]
MARVFRLLVLLMAAVEPLVGVEQRFAMEPQDQTAIVGSRVTLPCRIINKTGVLQWTKDDFGLGTHRNLSGFDRYSMIGSDEEGDFSLDIFPVMLDDDARYQCQVGPGLAGEPGIRSKFATLTVLVPPEPPRIVQGDFLVTTEDREIELECVSLAGKPAAEITWIDGLGNVLGNGLEYIVEALPDGRRFTAKSILKLTPKKEHHNTSFTCQAQNTADRTYRSARLRLEVKYAPKVALSIVSGLGPSGRLTEGADVRLACKADANPLDLTYRWYINDELVPGDYTTELMIPNITRKYHDAIVKCEVHNPVGKSEESETLDISYGPRFRTRPRSIQADLGTTITLSCDVDGNPPAEIEWIHDDTAKVVGTSANLTLDVDANTAGRYYCKASVMGFPEVGAEAAIYLKGPPSIVSHRTQFGIQGDNVRLECVAFSIPKPEHVMWTYKGNEVDADDKDYTILEDPLPEGIKSTLVIRESQQQHFGAYNCSVTNPYGSDVVEINLKPQKTFPLLMILTGVIGGVIVIIAIAMVIILCQRREKKPEDCREAEKQCKESDRSSNISDLKMELRTGSSVSNVHCELEYGPDSETGSESVVTRVGVPLAGPVPMPVNGGEHIYRYSAEFTDPVFPPKDGQNNNGYVPYVDYTRDYNPPPPIESSRESLSAVTSVASVTGVPSIDPRYSAVYGNPYLRNPNTSLPPAPTHAIGTPAPPPYSAATRNGAVPQVARLPNSPTSQYIVPTSQPATMKRGTLATHV